MKQSTYLLSDFEGRKLYGAINYNVSNIYKYASRLPANFDS